MHRVVPCICNKKLFYAFFMFIFTGWLVVGAQQKDTPRGLHSIQLCCQTEIDRGRTVSTNIILVLKIYILCFFFIRYSIQSISKWFRSKVKFKNIIIPVKMNASNYPTNVQPLAAPALNSGTLGANIAYCALIMRANPSNLIVYISVFWNWFAYHPRSDFLHRLHS